MNPTLDAAPAAAAAVSSGRDAKDLVTGPGRLPLWRFYVLRFGYLVIGVGLALTKWPVLTDHGSWPLMEGVVDCMLVAMSLLALLGVRYPVQMLPLLLLESVWKLIWLGVVAVPQWTSQQMDAATRETANACLWVVIVLAVIPWRYVFTNYVTSPASVGAEVVVLAPPVQLGAALPRRRRGGPSGRGGQRHAATAGTVAEALGLAGGR